MTASRQTDARHPSLPAMPATALSDAELLDQARNGDEAAFTELYVRHQPATLRLASTYRRLGDPEDLVNEAFEKVLADVRRGAGPTDAFRAYLFVTLRRLAAEHAERPADQPLDNVPEPVVAEAAQPEMARADRDIMNDAFESLPDRWQTVLWHTAVEGRAPRELASVLGVSATAAAALAYRAREKLRQAYLQAHLLASPHPECEPHRSRLGASVRGGLSRRDQAATKRHVSRCESCQALVVELTGVNRMLVRFLLPLFLVGSAQVAALAAAGAAGGVAAGTAGKAAEAGTASGSASCRKGAWRRVRDLAPSAGSVGVAAVLVAGLAVASMAVSRGDGPTDMAADAAGLGSSGFDGGRERAFEADPGDDGAPARDIFTTSPFDSPAGFGSDSPPDDGPPSRIDFRPRFDDGSPRRISSSPPPSLLSRPSGNAPTAGPPAAPAPLTPTPPTPRPPGRPDPAPPPPAPPVVVVPLAFVSAPEWAPSGVGRGDLTVRIGEANAQAASAAAGATAAVPRQLQIQLTSGAQAAEDGLDSRCTVVAGDASQRIDCTIQPPAHGGTVEVHTGLNAAVADQSATVTLRRGSVVEGRAVVPLDRYEEGLGLVASAWAPFDLAGYELPIGRLTIGAEHRGTRPLPGVSLEVTLEGDAGFVPAVPGIDLLPEGCSTPGWPPPDSRGEISLPPRPLGPPALLGGLPTTVACDLGELAPGNAAPLRDLVALVRPWYRDDDGIDEAPSATVTLRLQDPAGDPNVPPEVHELATETIGIDLPEG
jgi:RNA polymerase sigma factor (sigma-70 family)